MVTVEGIVEEIIFKNESNGFIVAILEAEGDSITIVGYDPFLKTGQSVRVVGDMVYHPNYGEQIEIESISTITPDTLDGIEKYLSSGLIPYVGKKTAKKIVEKFGKDSLEIIEYHPERLKEIEGIGKKKVKKISEAFEDQRELRDVMVFLQQYNITPAYGIRIYKKYGKDTINIITENPYRLSEDVFGIGFKKADEIARNMGIAINSPYRIEAGIKFKLMKWSGNGHTYVPQNILIEDTKKMLRIEEEIVEESIRDLAIRKEIQLENIDGEILIYYMPFYMAEANVSRKIVEISRVELEELDIDVEKEIEKIEDSEGIVFAKKQKEAIKESVENGMLIITGGPGTGKTTTINAIIKLFEEKKLKIALAAPTGRAAKRMSQATDREAKTIHRLLEYSFMEEEMGFERDEGNPLDVDVVIIDEASMVDIILMNNLLKAIMPGTRVIFIGDIDQLPSVGPGNVLKDIIKSGVVKVVKLDEIFRQAEESMIVVNAHKINKGEFPSLNVKGKDFYFIPKYNPKEVVETILGLCNRRLPNFNGYDSLKDIQVLTPMKKGDIGTNSLNKHLQEILNPKGYGKSEKKIGDEIFRVGDKIMQIKNNYTTEWEIIENGVVKEKGEGVYNGDFGFIVDIDNDAEILKVLFDDEKEVEYDFGQLDELKLAYATTVHKSQGSEFPVVIMPISGGPPMLLTRNLLYTAITRAKELVVLVGEERYLSIMIQNNRITKRYSGLDFRMKRILTYF